MTEESFPGEISDKGSELGDGLTEQDRRLRFLRVFTPSERARTEKDLEEGKPRFLFGFNGFCV